MLLNRYFTILFSLLKKITLKMHLFNSLNSIKKFRVDRYNGEGLSLIVFYPRYLLFNFCLVTLEGSPQNISILIESLYPFVQCFKLYS
jgi:hypothetical protein